MLNAIFDYFKDIIEGIKERVRNPFTERNTTPFAGAFVIALVLYNWRLFFSIFSFDSNETRLSKIAIISCYLNQHTWIARIGYPILIAFGSIIFFYVLNNISLGITIIANRWLKAAVLFIADRSKIIPREELEKVNNRANTLKQSYDRIKSERNNSEDEKATLDKQLAELTGKYDQAIAENEKLKVSIETKTLTSTASEEAFAILFARYGKEEVYNDVTNIVKGLLISVGKFSVDNRILEGDPISYSIKELFIIYKHGQETVTLIANEAEMVELKDGKLIASTTDLSNRKQNYLRNQTKIGDIFNGSWVLTFVAADGVTDTEPIIVDNTGRYFAHSKHSFFLRTINIDEATKKITFNKIDLQRKLHSKESLTIQNDDLITGTDSKGYRLEYRRQTQKDIKAGLGTLGSSKIEMAKYPFNSSIGSQFLKSDAGTFNIWAHVSDIHNAINDPVRFMYIVGYASNGGDESGNPAIARYPNAWAIQRITPTRNALEGVWRFWCNNVGKDSIRLDFDGTLTGGWHLFTVSWSSVEDYIVFIIDNEVVDRSKFINWPSDFSRAISLGTWPKREPRQFFDSKIGPWEFVPTGYDNAQIEDFYRRKPE